MGRRAGRWPAILTGAEQILGARWLSLFRAAPRPVQQALLAVGRHAPGRSVRWGNLRRLRPFSNRYGNDQRIHGDALEVKDANYSRRFGNEVRCRVVGIDPENAEADLHLAATDFWRWTPGGLAELLGRVGMPARAAGYGDVLACVAALWGLSVQDLSAEELDGKHPYFPPVACAHADKPA